MRSGMRLSRTTREDSFTPACVPSASTSVTRSPSPPGAARRTVDTAGACSRRCIRPPLGSGRAPLPCAAGHEAARVGAHALLRATLARLQLDAERGLAALVVLQLLRDLPLVRKRQTRVLAGELINARADTVQQRPSVHELVCGQRPVRRGPRLRRAGLVECASAGQPREAASDDPTAHAEAVVGEPELTEAGCWVQATFLELAVHSDRHVDGLHPRPGWWPGFLPPADNQAADAVGRHGTTSVGRPSSARIRALQPR